MKNRIYEKLKDDDYFKDRLEFNEAKNCLTIVFNEYVVWEYFEGNYKACYDEGYLCRKGYGTHCHITCDEEVLGILNEIANEDDVYIEDTNPNFFSFKLKIMKKEKFEKNKDKYMKKKSLRIYTVNSIIKRNGE